MSRKEAMSHVGRAEDTEDSSMTFVAGVMAGAVVGAGVALLFAPSEGAKLRREIFRSARRTGKAVAKTVDELTERGREVYEGAREVVTRVSDEGERVAADLSKQVDKGLAAASDLTAARRRA